MIFVVITHRKWLNIFLVMLLSILVFGGLFYALRFLSPQTEITLEQRMSFFLPSQARMDAIYMTSSDFPAIQADSLIGRKWITQKIEQQNMSEITFQYPETLRLDEIRSLGPEITIHMNYRHNDNKMIGFFQVWTMERPMEEFLVQSKKYSSMTFSSFKTSEFKVQSMEGVLWEYVFMSKTQDIHGLEAFIENADEMYRFTMYIAQENYKPAYKKMFQRIVQSLRVTGKDGPVQ